MMNDMPGLSHGQCAALLLTGEKVGVWWKVNDELGNEGWVVSTNLQLAH